MPKTNPTANLPAPLSLTLDEVREVAAGSASGAHAGVVPWWWCGQPANAYLGYAAEVTTVANLAVGPIAAGLVAGQPAGSA